MVYVVMAMEAHVNTILSNVSYQLPMRIKQVSSNEKGRNATMPTGYVNNLFKSVGRLLGREAKSPVDHDGATE